MTAAADLAADLGVAEGDVHVIVETIVDLHDDDIPPEISAEVRAALDPHGERTAPANLYWPGHIESHLRGGPAFRSSTHHSEPVWLWDDEEPINADRDSVSQDRDLT